MALPTRETLTVTYSGVTETIEVTDTLFAMRNNGTISTDIQIDTDSVYTSFNGQTNDINVAGAKKKYMEFDAEAANIVTITSDAKYTPVNLRFAFTNSDVSYIAPSGVIRWTNLDEYFPLGENTNPNPITWYDYTGAPSNKTYPYFYNGRYGMQVYTIVNKMPAARHFCLRVQQPLRYVPIANVQETDDYIFFTGRNIDNGSTGINDTYLPGGENYNDTLYNKGYMLTADRLYFTWRPYVNFYMGADNARQEITRIDNRYRYFTILAETVDNNGNIYYDTLFRYRYSTGVLEEKDLPLFAADINTKNFKQNYGDSGQEGVTPNYSNAGNNGTHSTIAAPYTPSQSANRRKYLLHSSYKADGAFNAAIIPKNDTIYTTYCIEKSTGRMWQLYPGSTTTTTVAFSDVTHMSIKQCMQLMAATGVYFTFDANSARLSTLGVGITDDKIFLGDYNDAGQTVGTWKRGAAIADTEYAQRDNVFNPDFEPEKHGGGGGEDDSGTPSGRGGNSIGNTRRFNVGSCDGFITQYCMNAAQVSEMGGKIWEALALRDPANTGVLLQSLGNLAVQFEESVAESAGLTVRPGDVMSNIISLRQYPFNLADFVSYEEAGTNIFVGNGKAAVPLTSVVGKMTTYSERIDGGGGIINVPRKYNDFRDYDAKYEIYVPFCGSAELPAENVVGTTLAMHYGIDFATGGMIAVCLSIDSNGLSQPVAVLSGQVGANVPLSFSGQITAEKMLTSIAGGFNIVSRAGRAIALQGVGGLVNPDLAYDAANLAAQASRPDPVYKISSGSDFSSLLAPDLAYLSITYGKYNIPENYAHTVGNAVNTTAQLGTLSGFTVCENVDVSGVPCSAEEAAEIKKYLESGVYL